MWYPSIKRGLMTKPNSAFTLLELLIILAIVSVLVQLAIPQYSLFIEKAHAHERLGELLSLQTELEICYFSHMDYEVCGKKLNSISNNILIVDAKQFNYHLSLHAPSPTDICYQFETNEAHEITAFDNAGNVLKNCDNR
jgi:Tfp pilus assembly protein PilE